jgi:dihydrofolate reductase
MRTLTYLAASTLDGFVAGPDGSDPTGPGGFWPVTPDYVEHLVRHYPETLPAVARDALGITAPGTTFDTVLEGRNSYELGMKAGVIDAFPHLRHVVFSTTLVQDPDSSVEIVGTDPVAFVRDLKQQPGSGIWLVGGGGIAASLLPEIDRLVLKVAPLTIGTGIGLFGRDAAFAPQAWRLTERAELPSGALFLTYDRADSGTDS